MSDSTTKHAGGRPKKFESAEQMQQLIDEYFASCFDFKRDMFGNRLVDKTATRAKGDEPNYIIEQVRPFTITGLAVALGTTRDLLLDYGYDQEFSDTIKTAKEQVHQYAEESLYTKGAAGAIFNLKNNYGWRDKTEVDSTVVADVTSNGETVGVTDLDKIIEQVKKSTEA